MIHIVYITDDGYLLPTAVSMRSLIAHMDADTQCTIHVILSGEITPESRRDLLSFQEERVTIDLIDGDTTALAAQVSSHHHVSKAALLKFQLADLLPDLDRVLYLDGDTLIMKDLTELYETDIQGRFAAVVADLAAMIFENWHNLLGLPLYFNSGMMLLNLPEWRRVGMQERLIHEKLNEKYIHFMDQNVLNIAFEGNVRFVHIRNNHMFTNTKGLTSDNLTTEMKTACFGAGNEDTDLQAACADPVILHLTNIRKPWKDPTADKYDQWSAYLSLPEVTRCIQAYYVSMRKSVLEDLAVAARGRHESEVEIAKLKLELHNLRKQYEALKLETEHQLRRVRNRTLYGTIRYAWKKLTGKSTL